MCVYAWQPCQTCEPHACMRYSCAVSVSSLSVHVRCFCITVVAGFDQDSVLVPTLLLLALVVDKQGLGHEPVCFVHAKMTSNACALLEFTTAPLPILRVSGVTVVDIGITTTKSPALDIAALCLDSWPAAIFAQVPISDSCQRLHVILQQTRYCKMILRQRAACHCIMA